MAIKLLMFDLDGTLVDSRGDITNALNYATKPYGFREFKIEEITELIGEGVTRLIEKVIGGSDARLKDTVTERFLDYYSRHISDLSTIYPGVRETIEKLDIFKKAVISNKREHLSVKLLRDLDLLKYFGLVVGSDTTPEKKPSAMPVIYVLSKLGAGPGEAVFVGDSNYDIEAGSKAGVTTVAVSYGYKERRYLKGADHIIDRFGDLLAILDTK
ncbi:MAG: HAD-IA family hydrolase [Nitrospirota bacterium]